MPPILLKSTEAASSPCLWASTRRLRFWATAGSRPFQIILPQVIKRILPSVTNEVITLVKDTSLAFTLSVAEMFSIAKALAASQTNMIPFVAAGLFYYIFNLVVAVGMEWVEKKMDYYR